jgi:hypothetical protein
MKNNQDKQYSMISRMPLNRRGFIKTTALAGAGLTMMPAMPSMSQSQCMNKDVSLTNLSLNLLKDWCEGMLNYQLADVHSKGLDGGLICPACSLIHGRCGDAIYPLLFMADHTGDSKYLESALALYNWMENNVSWHDGSWVNDANSKKPWKLTTVFGAIALAEGIYFHGRLLDTITVEKWKSRLIEAGDFVCENIYLGRTNINYPVTLCYAMALLGRLLDDDRYIKNARNTASEVLNYFSENDTLLYGEGKPYDKRSPKGCVPVDLGYNVEESLPALVLYAKLMDDERVLSKTIESLHAHAGFMLPDGGWDNSWGTRNFKWTYWGSRTSDGCQPAYALLADKSPDFYKVAYQNTALLKNCTENGLLHGGPHYISHGILPCIHHTFCHAKALACILNHKIPEPSKNQDKIKLPRSKEYGVKAFNDIQTYLIAKGEWRATITGYDREYYFKNGHASGGALSMLWHKELGPILSASLNEYQLIEENNMQIHSDPYYMPLTPRLQFEENGVHYMNISDLSASINYKETKDAITFHTQADLVDEDQNSPDQGRINCKINYRIEDDCIHIIIEGERKMPEGCRYIIPIVSRNNEKTKKKDNEVIIHKNIGSIKVFGNTKANILPSQNGRIFNYVPGLEAVPIAFDFDNNEKIEIQILFERNN